MGWRSSSVKALESAATQRLARLAREWTPGPTAEEWRPLDAAPELHSDPWRAAMQSDESVDRTRGWNGRAIRALLILVAVCLAAACWWWWSGRPLEVVSAPIALASGTPIATSAERVIEPRPSSANVVVDVTGLVVSPGLVTLPSGARVADAVAAAGGPTKTRATDSVNMARVLVDGEQIVIGGVSPSSGPISTAPELVDLNSADPSVFETLPGVGPVLAARILEWRQLNGRFRSVDELGEVSGIGDAILARLRPLVRV